MSNRRVVHVVRSDSFAGVERYMCDVGRELGARGWDVLLVGGDPQHMAAATAGAVRLAQATSTAGACRVLAAAGRPDVVHAHMSAAELAAVVSRPRHRAPVVATRHFDRPRGEGSRTKAVTRLAARFLAAEVSISEFVGRETGPGSVVIPNGVPLRAPRPRPAFPPYVLTLQRLEEEKDPLTALRAWDASGLATLGATLKIAGRGSQRELLMAEVRRRELLESVELMGFVPNATELLRGAACLLATAPREPFGLSVLEAVSHGVPVVAAAGGAHLETLQGSCLLFPAGDAAAAGRALRRALELDEEVTSDVQRLLRRQQSLYSLKAHVDALENLYGSLR